MFKRNKNFHKTVENSSSIFYKNMVAPRTIIN